ncbi:MAG: dipeptidyl aminopeptidase/acylaminoacyl peptidase [Alteromonadaceae bacterium]
MILNNKTLFQYFLKNIYIASLIFSAAIQAATVEDFSRHLKYRDIKISPDGEHLAALVKINGLQTLAFIETKSGKITYTISADRDNQPAEYYWVNNERVIIQVEQLRGALEAPLNYGELFAVNYDGTKRKMIYGYRSKSGIAFSGSSGFLIDILPDDKKHVLIWAQQLSYKSDTLPKVVKLNIYNGREKRVKKAPIAYSKFLIDDDGVPRFVSGIDKNAKTKLFYSKGKGAKWQPFGDEFEGEFTPLFFAENVQSIYALKSENGETEGLYKYNIKTKKETLLYRSEFVDPTYVIRSSLNHVFGLRIDEDYPSYIYLDDNNEDAQLHKALYRAFKGDSVAITSKTDDGKTIIVKVSGDRNPGEFYLFDTTTMKGQYLFNSAPWLKLTELAAVEPFRIKTPDGLTLNGFMTLPKGKSANLPTVVLPHGGPHARDYWQYDPQVQMLANAGYAVIQVNFRGSRGYGKVFMEAGYENWGSKIQDDILLATNYAIQQGVADKNKICIFGTSFGGYSALQSAIKSPDLFKCAIGYAGVYDLPMLFEEGDIKAIKWGDAFLNKTLGLDEAKQIAQSPVYHVDKLKAPVLLIHGEDDQRAPIAHAEKLKDALEQHNHPYEWFVKDKEGHGFYDEANILEANKKILSFLNKNIGA